MEETLYNTLKVEEDAPPEIIRAAYKVLSGMYHPDKNSSAEANELMQKINNAYRILRDPEMRARYDESLRKARGQATEQQQPPESSKPAPAQETAKPRASKTSSVWSSWLPIILCVIAGKLLGLVGALSAIGVYYWVKPRKGAGVASIAAIVGSLATTLAVAAFLQVQQPALDIEKSPGLKPFHGKLDSEEPPSFEEAKYWTQEETNSADVGPWLQYAPQGTRFCRLADRAIVTVYPPGVKPQAEKANPFCVTDSVSSPEQL